MSLVICFIAFLISKIIILRIIRQHSINMLQQLCTRSLYKRINISLGIVPSVSSLITLTRVTSLVLRL